MAKIRRRRYFHIKQRCKNETDHKPAKNTNDKNIPDNNGDENQAACGACAGLIFMCNESTKIDCFKYRVFGLSERKKNLMDVITRGMCLFLFDVNSKLLYGIYAASSCGAFMLEPDAFGGDYPWQVKFHIQKACLPLKEDNFKSAIKDNYFTANKFKRELNAEQVQKLASLFSPLPGGPIQHPPANASNHRVTPRIDADSFTETGGHIQDRQAEGYNPSALTYCNKTVGFAPSDRVCKPYCRPAHSVTDGVTTVSCMHGFQEPALPLNDAVATTDNCKLGHHVPKAKQGCLPVISASEAHKADGFIPSRPLRSLNCDSRHPPNDDLTTGKCKHSYHASQAEHVFLPSTSTCQSKHGLMQSALPKPYHEPKHPLKEVVAQNCVHNHHMPTDNHKDKCATADEPHQQCREERNAYMSSHILGHNYACPLPGPSYATSTLQNTEPNHIRTGAELYSDNSASYANLSVMRQEQLMSNAVHGNSWDRKLCEGELVGVMPSICSHAKLAAKAPGILNALPKHSCAANPHERPRQDTYAYARGIHIDALNTSGERPLKCRHYEAHRRPIHYSFGNGFGNAVDGVPPNV